MANQSALSWYFDYISPFAYLQWPDIKKLSTSMNVSLKPVLFAGLLQRWGHLGPAEIPSKRLFTYQHVQWLAQHKGRVLNFPPAHPFNPLKALRLTLCCQSSVTAIDAIFEYLWLKGKSLEDPAFQQLCANLGVAQPEVALRDAAVKQALLDNGSEAVDKGVFGVPTAEIDGHLFWGQDATPMLLDYLANPAMMQSAEMKRVKSLPIGVSRV